MNILTKYFAAHPVAITDYADFWAWFSTRSNEFFKVVKTGGNIEKDFFSHVATMLEPIKDSIFLLTGMADDNTAELIFTADGTIANIVFIEELVNAAPPMPKWKFTALKPEQDMADFSINMNGLTFNEHNLSFYALEYKNMPDEIDLVVVYADYNNDEVSASYNGAAIFVDNLLGEINFITTIDNFSVISEREAIKDLIPITKLKDYLLWREKEIVAKYNETLHDSEFDEYANLSGSFPDGSPLIAIFNKTLLDWDRKASHPWILAIQLAYDGTAENGLPNNEVYSELNNFEEELMQQLKDSDGYLNIGRQTGNNSRIIFFACKEFRYSSRQVYLLVKQYSDKFEVSYEFYKDKYWRSLDVFMAD